MSTLNVVDISSNNNWVDLSKLKRAGADAVIIKATESNWYTNPYFESEIRQAIKLKMPVKAYHFFSGNDYKGNVDKFWSVIKPYAKYLGSSVVDYEGSAIVLGGVDYARKALKYMEKVTGKKPIIYMGLSDENNYNWADIGKNYDLWVAQYNSMNAEYGFHSRALYGQVRHFKRLIMFQYTSTGVLSNYQPLDLSVFYGSKADFNKDCKGSAEMSSRWKAPVEFDDQGAFKVQQKGGATFWGAPNNEKKVGHADEGKIYRITKVSGWFFKIANHEMWLDGRTGDFHGNPVVDNSKIHAKIMVVKTTAGHAAANTTVTGSNFKVGTCWKMNYYATSVDSKGKTWHWACVGTGKNKFINLDKCRVIV